MSAINNKLAKQLNDVTAERDALKRKLEEQLEVVNKASFRLSANVLFSLEGKK